MTMAGPRVTFAGGIRINVCTSNNNDDGKTITNTVTTTFEQPYSNMNEEELARALIANGGWNLVGDNTVSLFDSVITSHGTPGAMTRVDGGAPVSLLGSSYPGSADKKPIGSPVMFDLDSGGTQVTHILVGGLQIGSAAAPSLVIRHDTVGFYYYMAARVSGKDLGFGALGVTFQFGFPASALPDRSNDPAIDRLLKAGKSMKGLLLKLSIFEPRSPIGRDEYKARLNAGERPDNAVLAYVIGTIVPWGVEEFANIPNGRFLKDPRAESRYQPSYAEISSMTNHITVDLANRFRKAAPRENLVPPLDPISPNPKRNPLLLGMTDGEDVVKLGEAPYSPESYWAFGGLCDVVVAEDLKQRAAELPLVLYEENPDGSPLIIDMEAPVRLFVEERGLYFVDRESGQVTVHARKFGRVSDDSIEAGVDFESSSTPVYQIPHGELVVTPAKTTMRGIEINIPKEGVVLSFTATKPGFRRVNFNYEDGESTYLNLRAYPRDDYSSVIKSGKIPWDIVYREVLRYYHVMFPAMSSRFPLNDEKTVRIFATEIQRRISPAFRGTTLYMPVTRQMSPGKRDLLDAWCRQVLAGGEA